MQYLGERMSKLEIQQIHKSFIGNDGLPLDVIDNFSLDVEEKESIVILAFGCGKSTLLKILGGVLPASSGNLKLDSVDYGVEIPARAQKVWFCLSTKQSSSVAQCRRQSEVHVGCDETERARVDQPYR